MSICINKNSAEYQSLQNRAGVSELMLETVCSDFLENIGRFPKLDEIPNSNSKPYLEKALKIKNNNSTNIDNILEYTGKESIEEAVISLNTEFADQEVTILPINESAIVDVTTRPTDGIPNITESFIPDENPCSPIIFQQALNKLNDLYGIRINQTNDTDLASEKWAFLIPENKVVNGFIYEGQIYINTDRASVDTPIHELLHLLVGSLQFTNPVFYKSLIDSVEELPNYGSLLSDFRGRTRNDANEEIFISEISKNLTGQNSEFDQLGQKELYEIQYNVRRVLDSILMGDLSTKTITNDRLYNMSLKEVTQEVNSSIMTNDSKGFMNDKSSEIHRMLNNKKAELLEKGLLEEICE